MKIIEDSANSPEEPARRRGRPRSFDRETARDKAMMLFWQRGYEGTSINDLTEAMGITPPSLYTAFGSKEELYMEVLSLYKIGPGAYFTEALAEEKTAKGTISRLLHGAASSFTFGPGGCMISTAALSCAPDVKGVADKVAAMRSGTLGVLTALVQRAISDGEVPASTNPQHLARFYGAIIQGMSVQAHDGATVDELTAIAETAMSAWPEKASD